MNRFSKLVLQTDGKSIANWNDDENYETHELSRKTAVPAGRKFDLQLKPFDVHFFQFHSGQRKLFLISHRKQADK